MFDPLLNHNPNQSSTGSFCLFADQAMAFLKPSCLLLPRIFATPVHLQYLVIRHRFVHGRHGSSSSSSSTEKQLKDKEADDVHHKQENRNQAEAEAEEDSVLSRYHRGPKLPHARHGNPGQVNVVISSVSYEITDAEKHASNSSKECSAHPSSAHKSTSAAGKTQE